MSHDRQILLRRVPTHPADILDEHEPTDTTKSDPQVGCRRHPQRTCRPTANNEGWVNVGDTADTAEFAVESIRRWWNTHGQHRFPDATRLMITADCGGSNGYRVRAWKKHLADLAAETGLLITVCHYPPGTSKWNKIEHKMFSFISKNWRGTPLLNLRAVVELIAATTTDSGLKIYAEADLNWYPTGTKISNTEFAGLPINPHSWHGSWNYTINPAT